MKPLMMISTAPTETGTRVSLEVWDTGTKPGEPPIYRLQREIPRRGESRPDWAAVYAHRILKALTEVLEDELDTEGPSLYGPGHIVQQTIARALRYELPHAPQ